MTAQFVKAASRIAGWLALAAGAAIAAGGCTPADVRFNEDGLTAFRGGDYTRARAAFGEAIQQNPDVGAYYYNRGMCEQALGNLSQAVFNYDLATKINPSIIPAYNNAAACHQQLGQPDKALEELEQCTRANPFTGEAFICLGRLYLGRHDMYNAKLAMAKGVAADPDNPATHREYAQVLIQAGERDKAVQELRKSLELAPAQPGVSAQLTELAPTGPQLPPPKPQRK